MYGAAGARRCTAVDGSFGLYSMTDTDIKKGQPTLAKAALFGLCPDCGHKSLFANVTKFSDKCDHCGLDFSQFNVGDGPAAFLTMVVGAIVITMALLFDSAVHPPFWVHMLIWIPFTSVLVILSLRAAKGALLIAEHRNKTGEGKEK